MNYKVILLAMLLGLSACSVNTNTAKTADSTAAKSNNEPITTALFAKMHIEDTIKAGQPIELKFTVYNKADSVEHFCKWFTPFEPLMSKYLDVKDASGTQMNYHGAMAKRIMPPPASSYIAVNAKDSLSSTIDLVKAYSITTPSKYTVIYTAQGMSGLVVKG